eukprot:NODE_62_length_26495_cov_0.832853.p5 type:complete len:481 gc:universal NODE_62_length_26495_cov_0.832853:15237-16679(+)
MLLHLLTNAYYMKHSSLGDILSEFDVVDSIDTSQLSTKIHNWDVDITRSEVQGVSVYEGKIKDESDSKVMIVQHSDHFSGYIDHKDEKYRLDPLDVMIGNQRKMVLYKIRHLPTSHMPCHTGNHYFPSMGDMTNKIKRIFKRSGASKSCRMSLLADSSFQKQMGSDTRSKMIEALKAADEIYAAQFGINLEPADVKLLSENFLVNAAQSITGVLNTLKNEQSVKAYGTDPSQYCLVHLFTAKNFGTTTGLAYAAKTEMNTIGGICSGSEALNVGVSTTQLGSQDTLGSFAWHATVAHEIGHGFGASHDELRGCGGQGKLMQAVVNADINAIPGFSTCSITDIRAKLVQVNCFVAPSNPTQTAPVTNLVTKAAAPKEAPAPNPPKVNSAPNPPQAKPAPTYHAPAPIVDNTPPPSTYHPPQKHSHQDTSTQSLDDGQVSRLLSDITSGNIDMDLVNSIVSMFQLPPQVSSMINSISFFSKK